MIINKNSFETKIKCFKSILKFNKPLLYSMVESLINEKDYVDNSNEIKNYLWIKEMLMNIIIEIL